MVPNYLTSATPSPFPVCPSEDRDHHDDHHQQLLLQNYQTASSSSVSYSVFFPSYQDQTTDQYYHSTEVHHQRQAENHAPYTGSHDPEKKTNKGLRLCLWENNENQADHKENNPINKWMSPKVKLMQKMKKSDLKELTSTTTMKFEDQKQPTTFLETDHLSSNSNTPIRVCADCNTTKTPLWRSGPKGPKSLCNACGIRQRKARRAMAAAAVAAANGTSPGYETTKASLKIKVQNKEKLKIKKRCKHYTAPESSSSSQNQTHDEQKKKRNGLEDLLFNLSKNLAFHRVFPQDEKEAAILLMALSCGLVHG